MNISDVNHGVVANLKRKRLGRGTGSGIGKTSGRGHKGQRSRSGSSLHPLFEGGQMPLVRRLPKRGFNNKRFADRVAIINLQDLEVLFGNEDTVSPVILLERGIVKCDFDQLKILGEGELTKKLTVMAHKFSESAKAKIEAALGTIVVLPGKTPVVKNKMGTRKAEAVKNAKTKSKSAAAKLPTPKSK